MKCAAVSVIVGFMAYDSPLADPRRKSKRGRPLSQSILAAGTPLFPGYSALLPPKSGQKSPPPRPCSRHPTAVVTLPAFSWPQTTRVGVQPKPHLQDVAFGDILLAVQSPLPAWKPISAATSAAHVTKKIPRKTLLYFRAISRYPALFLGKIPGPPQPTLARPTASSAHRSPSPPPPEIHRHAPTTPRDRRPAP